MRFGLPVIAGLLATAGTVGAAPPPEAASPPASVHLDIKQATLDNGLRVVMLVDHSLPTVAIDVVYEVGTRNEERGRTGLAHLVELMMMSHGSREVPRGDHIKLVAARGGEADSAVTADHTSYWETLPSSELSFGLWLEADRMRSLDISPASFDRQRSAVQEDRRRIVEDAAYAPARLRRTELVFQGYWPYEHEGIGTTRDLDAAQFDAARAFHDAHYAPNRAIVSIAGDFAEADGLALVKRYFGDVPGQPSVPLAPPAAVPQQRVTRTTIVEDAHATRSAVLIGWMIPPGQEPDHYALELAAQLLGEGESSRLHRALVRERGVAVHVGASVRGHRGPDILEVDVRLARGARTEQVAGLVETQLADLARVGPTDEEMRKLMNRLAARRLIALESNLGRATNLAKMVLHRDDASLADGEVDKYRAVTKNDIARVVATHLTVTRRTTVEVKPGERR